MPTLTNAILYSLYNYFVLVKVLCKAGDQDFKAAFKFFIEKNMHKKLKWINNKTELKRKGKYVLLCNLENRLPGDIQRVLLDLGITSKFAMRFIKEKKEISKSLYLYESMLN